jgi:putative restriction endonuclease
MIDTLLDRFATLNVWSRGDQRAPHKPLLVLFALGRWCRGEQSAVAFKDAEGDLTDLLKRFGPARQSYRPEYPFWRLQNDHVWQVTASGTLATRASNNDPPKSELIAGDAHGGFSADVQAALRADPSLASKIAAGLLAGHFPESLHDAEHLDWHAREVFKGEARHHQAG